MTDLSQQTEQLLKALNTLHDDSRGIYFTLCVGVTLLAALVIITIFKRR